MKEKLKKISENVYELPKEGGMNVPGRIFASRDIFDSLEEKSVEQVSNVAKLPGIVGYSLAMPDLHLGYGFVVGGVAAFDIEKGIISPGGVGYDISCLTGDSKILTEFGNSIKIEDFENCYSLVELEADNQIVKQIKYKTQLPTLNVKNLVMENKNINLFMSKYSEDVHEIKLSSGLTIKASLDHPFLTKNGMKLLKELKNEELAVDMFEGVECNEIVDREEGIISKILGYMFGDGCMYESGNTSYGSLYGGMEDLEEIKEDLKSIGVNSNIYSRKRKHKIQTRYKLVEFESTNHELHIHSKKFRDKLKLRGMPFGNKTRQDIRVPDWIKESNKTIKRLFLAGFFGAELSSPQTRSKTNFYCPIIDQNKIASLKQNARDFLIDIALLLEEFGIENYKISEMDDYKNRYNEKTMRFRLIITGEDNMLKLWRRIGFEYNKKRRIMGNIASLYLMLKKQENNKRKELAIRIKGYRKKGLKQKEVQKILSSEINERFIERHYYENASQRISLNFIGFKDFTKQKLEEISKYGTIFDSIKDIKKIDGKFKVYDFNMEDNHNFIANSFIVSNCGVRLLASNITKREFLEKREEIIDELFSNVPCGVGRKGPFKITDNDFKEILEKGIKWAVKNKYGVKEDIDKTEDYGCIEGADASKISDRAKIRGKSQLGTLGAGNHFLEVQEVGKIFDKKIAKTFGIEKEGQIMVMIHCGSRGIGHQVATDYIKKMEGEYGFENLPDRELMCAPINSKLGKDYRAAMSAAANFALTNRHMIMSQTRKSFEKFIPDIKLNLVYDISHNIAKFEEYDGKTYCVHRKGATRSFGPGRKEIPKIYRDVGCPIFIPGSMGTSSYVLVGTKKAEEISFGSTAHGAGRRMSRHAAIKKYRGEEVREMLMKKNILVKSRSWKGIAEEAPGAYKDVEEVVRVSNELGIGNLVAKLIPLGVIKG